MREFDQANRLWFDEGRTRRALEMYEHARRAAPEDPVVAFQFARALWSVDRLDEAHAFLDAADARRDALSDDGRRTLDHWRERMREPARASGAIPVGMLDRDALDLALESELDWRDIADAAAARRMFGVAVYALERWHGVPIDADDAKHIGRIETNCHLDRVALNAMYARRRTAPRR